MADGYKPKQFAFAPDYVGGPALAQFDALLSVYEFGDGDRYGPADIDTACNVGHPVHYLTLAELETILAGHFAQVRATDQRNRGGPAGGDK